jgi:hypothetical protein
MAVVSFPALVNAAVYYFQEVSRMPVTDSGRSALINPALRYQEMVDRELSEHKITHGFLFQSVLTILDNGHEIALAERRQAIDDYIVGKSMKKNCPYIMWC